MTTGDDLGTPNGQSEHDWPAAEPLAGDAAGADAEWDITAAPRPIGLPRIAAALAAGYQVSPPAERALFGMRSSFAVTIEASRSVTYVRERQHRMPAVRSVGRVRDRVRDSASGGLAGAGEPGGVPGPAVRRCGSLPV
jgi:hypothetical protein